MIEYVARRRLLVNGTTYEIGEVIPGIEKLRCCKVLLSVGRLAKQEGTASPPASPPPTDLTGGEGIVPPKQEENEDVDLQRKSSQQ